jgi:hypothetical protein
MMVSDLLTIARARVETAQPAKARMVVESMGAEARGLMSAEAAGSR